MAYFKCLDPSNSGNYLVMENAMIGIYRTVAGASRLFTPLTQINFKELPSGQELLLPSRYREAPKVFPQASVLPTYVGGSNADQMIDINDPTVTSIGNGQYDAVLANNIVSNPSSNLFVPAQEIYREDPAALSGLSDHNLTWGPYRVDGVTGASAGIYFHCYRYKSNGSDRLPIYYRVTATAKIGISATQGSGVTYGAAVSNSIGWVTPIVLYPSVSASGNYVWINVTTTQESNTYTTGRLICPQNMELIQCTGIAATVAKATISTGGAVFNATVVGR